MLLGIIGKPNAGKSTFFSAITNVEVKIANYPFTTIDPNKGIAYFRIPSPEKLFNVKPNPRNYYIEGDWAFIPVNVIDVAGLVPDAHKGRGLGNKFLDDMRQAEALIVVVDGSGKTDLEGNPTDSGNPIDEIRFLEKEINMWMIKIVEKHIDKIIRKVTSTKASLVDELYNILVGISIKKEHIVQALERLNDNLSRKNLYEFIDILRRIAKPFVIALNKIDLVSNFQSLVEKIKREFGYEVIPCSAIAELTLRKAKQKGLIKYIPGEKDFEIIGNLNEKQIQALEYIRKNVLLKLGNTGVQQVIDKTVLEICKKIVVFPVENEKRLCDSKGNILPDAIVLDKTATLRDLARKIHSEFEKHLLYGIDLTNNKKLGKEDKLQHLSIIKLYVSV